MRNVRNRGLTHCGNTEQSSVLACGFREVTGFIVVGMVDGRRVTVHRSGLVELLGLKTCGVRGISQVAKLLGARAEVRLTRAFGSGRARRRRCGRERGVEVTVREQQRWRVKHEDREGEMEICDMHTANTFFFFRHLSHACTRCLYVTQRKCACDRSVCTQIENPSSNEFFVL